MSDLPDGTVALLYTDVEGSTALQRRLGDRYHEVAEAHHRLLDEAFTAHGGTVVDRQTESFFVVFRRTRDAVRAAIQAQRALAEHTWPDGAEVKVRMGIHAGEPEVSGDRYVGLAVSRAARICAAGHGRQVLLSSAARGLLGDDEGTALRTLGSYELKDFPRREPISQLVIEGLQRQFPPLRTGTKRGRRTPMLLAAASVIGVAAVIAGTWVTIGRDSSNLRLGPTSLGVIDPKTNELVKAIPLGFKSSLITAGEGSIWVADQQGGTLVRINPHTLKKDTWGIGADAIPEGLAVGHGAVWLAVLRGTQRVILKLGLEFADSRGEIPGGGRLAIRGSVVWAIDPGTGGLSLIDADTDRSLTLVEGLNAGGIAVSSVAVWVAGPPLIRIDPITRARDEVPTPARPGEVATVAVGLNAVWFATSSGTSLWRIDPRSNAVTDKFTVGLGPSAVTVGEGAVWVANSRTGSVTRIDPQGTQKEIPTGSTPGGIVVAYGRVWLTSGDPRA